MAHSILLREPFESKKGTRGRTGAEGGGIWRPGLETRAAGHFAVLDGAEGVPARPEDAIIFLKGY